MLTVKTHIGLRCYILALIIALIYSLFMAQLHKHIF